MLFYNIVNDMHIKSQTCFKIGDFFTNQFQITFGERPGDNLDPSVFKAFINDFPSYLD
jgi:hypothetical protein